MAEIRLSFMSGKSKTNELMKRLYSLWVVYSGRDAVWGVGCGDTSLNKKSGYS